MSSRGGPGLCVLHHGAKPEPCTSGLGVWASWPFPALAPQPGSALGVQRAVAGGRPPPGAELGALAQARILVGLSHQQGLLGCRPGLHNPRGCYWSCEERGGGVGGWGGGGAQVSH